MKFISKTLLFLLTMILVISPMIQLTGLFTADTQTVVTNTSVQSQTGYRILFDESHTALGSSAFTPGNASFLAWILGEYGYETDTNFNQQLDSGVLDSFDALVLVFPMVALTASEVTEVHNFVEAGGDLLLVGTDYSTTWHFTPANLNPISVTYGITFNLDSWLGTTTTMTTHPITYDVASIHTNLDYKLKGCTLSVQSPATTIVQGGGNAIVAVSGAGSGKVVAVSGLAPFLQYRMNVNWQVEKDDLFQFSLNIFDWFAGVTSRKVVVPETAIITVGSGPDYSSSELEDFSSYTGIIHDHTTHSDGQGTPDEMLWAGLTTGLDFMVITDHVYDTPNPSGIEGITGALAVRSIAESNGLDIEEYIGAELSHGCHSVAFPLTANIWASTQEEMITGAHAQGAMIALCHPTIGEQYMTTYQNMQAMGYDAVEVDNSGFTHGLLDDGFRMPFYGASDGHSPEFVGKIVNIIFVNQTSGLNGRLADVDVVNAIMNKRVVIRDFVTGIVYGQKVWVDRYLELMQNAENEIQNADSSITASPIPKNSLLLAEQYLHDAEIALEYANPGRAMRAALNAESSEALNIVLNVTTPTPRVYDFSTHYNMTLNITNLYSDSLEFNMTIYKKIGLSTGMTSSIVLVPKEDQILLNISVLTDAQGYAALVLNLRSFNATSSLAPTLWGIGGIIFPEYLSYNLAIGVSGTNVTGVYPINRGDSRYISSAKLFYNIGTGWQNVSAIIRATSIDATIGPYPKQTAIQSYAVVYDVFGGEFIIPIPTYVVSTDPLQPTTTTTTSNTGLGPLDPLLLIAIAGGAAAVIVIVVIARQRKSAV